MTQPVRIPADVDREDAVLANLNARQLLILAVTGIVLYATWTMLRDFVTALAFLALAIPVAGTAALLALGHRDGLSLDRLALAAVRQRLAPRHHVSAPEGIDPAPPWLTRHARTAVGYEAPVTREESAVPLPAKEVSDTGIVDLATDGIAAVAVCGTVNFALRTPEEQQSLVSAFGRYLHSLTVPTQILIRAERLDLSTQISELRAYASALPHPALAAAALEHADYLQQLGQNADLLRRQVLLVLREPLGSSRATAGQEGRATSVSRFSLTGNKAGPAPHSGAHSVRRAAELRLARRLDEASQLLGPMGIRVSPLTAEQTGTVLASACNPDSLLPPSAALAGAGEVITAAGASTVAWTEREPW
ncbi:PrgI family protein [Streptomyces lasiicapitis]|uniref:PrgI family protein n=1 Tax=Streptomyces lasiicapitis TaxID=1923961 RepID=UPI00333456E3